MRFASSLTLLTLTGLGLAAPFSDGLPAGTNAPGAVVPRDEKAKDDVLTRRHDSDDDRSKYNHSRHSTCLRPDDVDTLVSAYVSIISHWDDADAKYLADNLVDSSDSINILAGIPLGSPAFSNKQAFVDHQHAQPDNLPIVITHKSPFDCDEITLIWTATFGAAQKPVRGITILGATKEKGDWQIKSIDVEFNNIAYLENIGGSWKLPGQ